MNGAIRTQRRGQTSGVSYHVQHQLKKRMGAEVESGKTELHRADAGGIVVVIGRARLSFGRELEGHGRPLVQVGRADTVYERPVMAVNSSNGAPAVRPTIFTRNGWLGSKG